MLFKTQYYIGFNDRYTKVQEHSDDYILKYVTETLRNNHVEGFTIIKNCVGVYKYTQEKSLIIELLNDRLTSDCIQDLKDGLNQECIAEVVTECQIKFV